MKYALCIMYNEHYMMYEYYIMYILCYMRNEYYNIMDNTIDDCFALIFSFFKFDVMMMPIRYAEICLFKLSNTLSIFIMKIT